MYDSFALYIKNLTQPFSTFARWFVSREFATCMTFTVRDNIYSSVIIYHISHFSLYIYYIELIWDLYRKSNTFSVYDQNFMHT